MFKSKNLFIFSLKFWIFPSPLSLSSQPPLFFKKKKKLSLPHFPTFSYFFYLPFIGILSLNISFLATLFLLEQDFPRPIQLNRYPENPQTHQALKVNPSASNKNWDSEYLSHGSESTHTNPTSYCLRRPQQEIGTDA